MTTHDDDKEVLEALADWFNQDLDLVSGTVEQAIKDFQLQNGERATVSAARILVSLRDSIGYSPGPGDYLDRHGWEWFPNADRTGKTWLDDVIRQLQNQDTR